MNLQFLKHQMALGENKRKEQRLGSLQSSARLDCCLHTARRATQMVGYCRKEDIEAASAHDFPSFSEVHPNEMKDFIKGQQAGK